MGIKKVLGCISLLFVFSSCVAQQKTVHQDKSCYVHVVARGNTLYGISKQYAIALDELMRFNTADDDGLQVGEQLFIPIDQVDRKAAKKGPELKGSTLVHKVRRGETLFSLSKRYRVSTQEIVEANPSLQGGVLSKGMEIDIPTYRVNAPVIATKPASAENARAHKVIAKETIYGICKTYGISEEELRKSNPSIADGLKIGSTLQIPLPNMVEALEESEPDSVVSELNLLDNAQRWNITFLLPFALQGKDSSDFITPGSGDILKMTDIAFEFYRGARIALDGLEEEGLMADIRVIDMTSDKELAAKMASSPHITEADLIIGPLHSKSFENLTLSLSENRPRFISPLSRSLNEEGLKKGDVKAIPGLAQELEAIARYIRSNKEKNFIILGGKRKCFDKELLEMMSDSTGVLIHEHVKSLTLGKDIAASLREELSRDEESILILPCRSRPVITDFMAQMATSEMKEMLVKVIGLSDWKNYDNLDLTVMQRLEVTLPLSRSVDWSDKAIQQWVQDYKERYATTPSPEGYAFQGFDVVNYYMEGIHRYGLDFLEHQERFPAEGLHTSFIMRQLSHGGYVNTYCRMHAYRDGEWSPLESSNSFR